MFKLNLQYLLTAFLLSIGFFSIINWDIALSEWTAGYKAATVIIAILIYHNTVNKHNPNDPA